MECWAAVGGNLWRHADFLKLWAGESVSVVGTSVTFLALPTLAIFGFHAGPAQVGLLMALQRLPFPFLAIPVGAWIDRRRKRPVMIAADAGRFLALGSIPVAAGLGHLTLGWLYATALVTGVLTVFFDLAYLAYLPALVERRDLLEGNTKLEISWSVASVLGPGLGGLLIQLVGAARAIAVDALSYAASLAALLAIRKPEKEPAAASTRIHRDVIEGVRFVAGHPVLLSLLLLEGGSGLGFHAVDPVQYPFFYERLAISPATVGAIFAVEGVMSVVGAALVGPVTRRVGTGPAIALTGVVTGLAMATLPLAAQVHGAGIAVLVALFAVAGLADPINNVAQLTLRQSLTDDRLQARVNAVYRTVYWGCWPLGNLIGGWLGTVFGLVPTMVAGGIFGAVVMLAMLATPAGRVTGHGDRPPAPEPIG